MPSYCCKHPTCSVYLPERGYCERHADQGKRAKAATDWLYEQQKRSPAYRKFINSAGWERARRIKLASTPWCERCLTAFADHVHHTIPVDEATYDERIDQKLLKSVCRTCHATEESELRRARDMEGSQ